jgi:outer membrane protein OmpA-like peptidoglycan-associated protein
MRLWSNPFFTSQINPNEFMLTASAGLSESVNGFAGFALGNLVTHDDGNDYRVTVGLKVAPCVWGVICKKDKGQKLESVQVEKAPGVELVEAYSPPYLPPSLPPPPPPVVTNKLEFKNDSSMFTGEEVVESSNVAEQLPVNVSDSEVTYVVRYPQNIAFISMKDRARLKKVLLNLKGDLANIKAIKIVGHASAEGASEMNKEISYMRAVMMKNELRKEGIPASKIQMGYFGSDQPSEADLPANRRVELQIVR